MNISSIDIFCHCVDNYGDAGVAYRFAKELKTARPDYRVRVFIDNIETIHAIASGIEPSKDIQEYEGITYINTSALYQSQSGHQARQAIDGIALTVNQELIDSLGVSDVMVEAFACHIPTPLLELAYERSKLIINLEHLSAEDWVEGYHLKESLLGRGIVRKYFFMPGLREGTGGLVINSRLREMRESGTLDRCIFLNDILGQQGITITQKNDKLIGTIFTYERGFDTLIADLADMEREVILLVFGDKSHRGMWSTFERLAINRERLPMQNAPHVYKNVRVVYMPFFEQHIYDTLLCCADFNIVRGEDSLARAILSGKPFIWNAYIQDEKYQTVKVKALLETMRPFYGRCYSDAGSIFADYNRLMLDFNDASVESPYQTTQERYDGFLKNLQKHEYIAMDMYYFIECNCNLIVKFCEFLDNKEDIVL